MRTCKLHKGALECLEPRISKDFGPKCISFILLFDGCFAGCFLHAMLHQSTLLSLIHHLPSSVTSLKMSETEGSTCKRPCQEMTVSLNGCVDEVRIVSQTIACGLESSVSNCTCWVSDASLSNGLPKNNTNKHRHTFIPSALAF